MKFLQKILHRTFFGREEDTPVCANRISCDLDGLDEYMPLVGEFAWHSLTYDVTLDSVSDQHLQQVVARIDAWAATKPSTILEIGAYAHSTGYMLQEKYAAEVTLFDLSESTLRLGRDRLAVKNDRVDLVAGDFHDLPFADGYFDVVYIFATLHHSRDFKRVLNEVHRVMAPNGLLCVFQEPFKREACFYQFRTNRLGKLTSFERALEAEDLLTTIAEPTPGSRDEILFGMIENQEILLQEWLESLCGLSCAPLEVTPHYLGKVGQLGNLWLGWGRENISHSGLARRMTKDFCERLDRVRPALDMTARGLGFGLPEKRQVAVKFDSLAKQIQSLPHDQESSEYQAKIASIFGGSLTFTGRKRATVCNDSAAGFIKGVKYRGSFPTVDGVRVTFCNESLRRISQSKSCIPFFDALGRDELLTIFPDSQWLFAKQDNGFWSMDLTGSSGEIVLPPTGGNLLLVLRINLTLDPHSGRPFRLKILYGEKEFLYDVYQEEAILFRAMVDVRNENLKKKVVVATEALSHHPGTPVTGGGVKVYYAGAFSLRDVEH